MADAFDWEPVKDGVWATSRGDTIHKVSPRGETLYAVRLAGSKRPEWLPDLATAKRYRGKHVGSAAQIRPAVK